MICSSYQVDPLKLSDSKMLARKKRSNEFDGKEEDDDVMKSPLTHRSMPRVAVIDCFSDTAYCHRINCSFYGDFNKDDTISLKFTARLWNSTLVEVRILLEIVPFINVSKSFTRTFPGLKKY